ATTHRTLDVRDCAAEITASNRYADSRLENLAGKVTVDARGRVYVESIDGDVDVRAEYSPIEVRDVRGAVKVASTEGSVLLDGVTRGAVVESRGGNVTAQKLAGGLKLSASHRRVRVEDVQGDVAINSRYATLSLTNVQGKVDLTSSSDRISAEGVRGALTARATGSSVRIDAASGPIDVSTTRKDVTVNDFASSCKVVNEYADVSLSSARTLGGEVSVKNRNGDIEIYLPDAAGFALDAHARMGRIDTDYPGLETPERPADAATLKTKVRAGGPTLVLDTEYGSVRIRSRKGDSLPAEHPEEPRPRRVGIVHRDRAGR
ncbi:MAG: DUF4097 family beta strand repeat protein, partial [Deltaproteobacteria bacterium]|nr:DUF4097 family beta strand repeat protein [Deltaproteobacteria bacterium]